MLDAIARSDGRRKGIAVVPLDIGSRSSPPLKGRLIVGIAFNSTLEGVEYYLGRTICWLGWRT